jgi:hypothetical protein
MNIRFARGDSFGLPRRITAFPGSLRLGAETGSTWFAVRGEDRDAAVLNWSRLSLKIAQNGLILAPKPGFFEGFCLPLRY